MNWLTWFKAKAKVMSKLTSVLFFLLFNLSLSAQDFEFPTRHWVSSTFAKQGLNPDPIDQLHQKVGRKAYGLVDRMLVVKNGFLLADYEYDNDYQAISKGFDGPLGCGFESCDDASRVNEYNYYHPDFHPFYQGSKVHSLQSTTKSVASVLVGVAVQQGLIKNEQVALLSFFENYDLSKTEERLKKATLEDLLTMRSGIEWHEQDRPLDETNTTLLLERSEDWIQFTLDQPMDADPGEKWAYSSGGSHLMSGIIKEVSGEFIDSYAEKHLFGPLGIENYHWKKTPQGYPDTEGGLYLEAPDLAKIGLLMLKDGVWDGKRIISSDWVQQSVALKARNVNSLGWGYGYQWWRLDRNGTEVWATLGFGENYMIVLPEHNLIGVINAWNLFGHQGSVIFDFVDALIDSAKKG